MTNSDIKIDGTIESLSRRETRDGRTFYRVRVTSPTFRIDVDVFPLRMRRDLDLAMPGDRLVAAGSGFHRGNIRSGTTSLTARTLKHTRHEEGRNRFRPPTQMDLFAA